MLASHSHLSDNELAHNAKHDLDAFTALYERFFDQVYRFFFLRLRNREDAEDLTSETFEKIFTKLSSYTERGVPFSAWVFTVARRTLIDFIRRNKRCESIDDVEEDAQPRVDFDVAAIDTKLLTEKLWAAVATLSERHQQLWALKLSSDLPHGDIAAILGTTESNVNVMIHRSFAILKQRLHSMIKRS